MLRRLKVHRYRNVAPGTELHFSDGHHVLLGPNGGGKTTLLTLIPAVLRGEFSGLGDEEFDLEYEMVEAAARLDVRIAWMRRRTDADSAPTRWDGAVNATMQMEGSAPRSLSANNESVTINGKPAAVRVGPLDLRLHRSVRYALFGVDAKDDVPDFTCDTVKRFDEGLAFFHSLLGTGSIDADGPLRLEIFGRPPEQFPSAVLHVLLSRSIDQWLRVWQTSAERDRLQLRISDLGELADVVDLLGMKSGVFRADLGRNDRDARGEQFVYDRFQFRFTRRDGTYVIDEHLSFGQKRLLAFLFYAWANQGPIVADELVDGMHHRWIEHCLKAIGDRQAFLSSQSPLLMDFFGFDSAEAVRRCFVLCDLEVQGDRELMRWRSMTPEEADQFFDAYQVGIQHVSEILRDRGLW